jgi:hypothetical protein
MVNREMSCICKARNGGDVSIEVMRVVMVLEENDRKEVKHVKASTLITTLFRS